MLFKWESVGVDIRDIYGFNPRFIEATKQKKKK